MSEILETLKISIGSKEILVLAIGIFLYKVTTRDKRYYRMYDQNLKLLEQKVSFLSECVLSVIKEDPECIKQYVKERFSEISNIMLQRPEQPKGLVGVYKNLRRKLRGN